MLVSMLPNTQVVAKTANTPAFVDHLIKFYTLKYPQIHVYIIIEVLPIWQEHDLS